jgi:hypothetical protein
MSKHLASVTTLVLTFASLAMAQEAPSNAPAQNTTVSYAVAVVVSLAIIGLSILSAKRTHQD